MASLTSEDRVFIEANPLSDHFHSLVSELDTQDEDLANTKEAISNILIALHLHPFTRRPRTGYRPINRELISINARLDTEDLDLSLFKLIANKANDIDIWLAVLELILTLSRTTPTPLTTIPPSFKGTPRTFSSASFQDSEQKREDLREALRYELIDCTYHNVQGFFTKYFEDRPWSKSYDQILDRVVKDAALHNFPNKKQPEEDEVWEWLNDFQKKYLTQAPGVYYRAESKAVIKDAQGQRQLDVLLKSRNAPTEGPHSAHDLRIIGELTKSPTSVWKGKFLQLATYIRDAFAAQPTRWFIHGFLMFGSQIQLWGFDRSGAYGAEMFDVREHPERLIRVIAGYSMMSDAELGLSPVIKHPESGPLVTVKDAINGEHLDLLLETTPIVSHPVIVSRGTTCFLTRDKKNVVKMSWRANKEYSEATLLAMAQGVRGVPQLIGSENVTSIKELRSNLDITTKRDLGPQRSTDSPASTFTSLSTHAMARLDMNRNKRRSESTDKPPSKKHRSSRTSKLQQDSKTPKQSLVPAMSSSPHRSTYRNRILTCLAITPAGRPLQRFNSVLEVLHAFRDTIKAHRSLFLEHNILHRDVSMNNIILTDPTQNGGCTGILIDLDLAVLVDKDGKNKTSEEKTMTGTLEYIAIQILENQFTKETAGIEHTYRHDLESFFYVFLSLCIRGKWYETTRYYSDPLKAWYTGTFQSISMNKRGSLEPGGFEINILNMFSPTFQSQKDLARLWRKVLFGGGALQIETPESPESLYGPIIKAIEDAIQDIKW